MTRSSEDELIARYFAPLAGPGALDLRDDAALLTPEPGHELVVTVDAIVAGIDFLPEDPPASIGRKALGVNLSDLAAKGATPLGYLLTLALPDSWTEDWLTGFAEGLSELGGVSGCGLLGGDTVRAAGPLLVTITAIGQVPAGRMVRRTTAQPGDVICVSGTIGDGVLGLRILQGGSTLLQATARDEATYLIDRYQNPRPRSGLAPVLRDRARAAMDISDGLVGDLIKMMRAGGTGARVDLGKVPFSDAARAALRADPGLRDTLVTGGDDYEILACVPATELACFLAEARATGVEMTPIGEVLAGHELPGFFDEGTRVSFRSGSFAHF